MNCPREKRRGGNPDVTEGANTPNGREADPTRAMQTWRCLAQVGLRLARWALDRYALATDGPELGVVEAANLLDAAHDALSEATP